MPNGTPKYFPTVNRYKNDRLIQKAVVILHRRMRFFATFSPEVLVERAGDFLTELAEIVLGRHDETEIRRFDRNGNFRAVLYTIILDVRRGLIPSFSERHDVFCVKRELISRREPL